jgi:uncharacterized membrane protein HdeD (DUF308 family)
VITNKESPASEQPIHQQWWNRGANVANQPSRVGTAVSPQATYGRRDARTGAAGVAALFICGVLMMAGSTAAWVTTTSAGHTVSQPGIVGSGSLFTQVNGWLTFIVGTVLLVLGAVMIVSREPALRLLALLFSLTGIGFGVSYLVRILHDMSKAHATHNTTVGWGLIVVLVGALGSRFRY